MRLRLDWVLPQVVVLIIWTWVTLELEGEAGLLRQAVD
jgi:hypothetical protein